MEYAAPWDGSDAQDYARARCFPVIAYANFLLTDCKHETQVSLVKAHPANGI